MRTVLLPIHIIAGLTAIITGFMALYAAKGAQLHRKLGMIFVYSMVILGLAGAVMALLKLDVGTALGGVLAFYLVITGLVTFRRDGAGVQWIDRGAALLGWTLGLTYVTFGFQASYSITGRKYGYQPPLYFVFGAITLLAAIGDARPGKGVSEADPHHAFAVAPGSDRDRRDVVLALARPHQKECQWHGWLLQPRRLRVSERASTRRAPPPGRPNVIRLHDRYDPFHHSAVSDGNHARIDSRCSVNRPRQAAL